MAIQPVSEAGSRENSVNHYQIQRQPLPNELAKRLRKLILDGELKEGARVHEKILSEQFGVSRTPLREAFKILATEGLIELLPHRGAIVSRLTPEDLDHMFPVLEAIEGLAGELACAKISKAEIAEIRSLHNQLFESFKSGRRDEYFNINRLIHEKIIAAAANPVLSSVYASLGGKLRRARYTADISDEAWKEGASDHKQILKAIINRDGKRLSRLLKKHLEHKHEGLKAVLRIISSGDVARAIEPDRSRKQRP